MPMSSADANCRKLLLFPINPILLLLFFISKLACFPLCRLFLRCLWGVAVGFLPGFLRVLANQIFFCSSPLARERRRRTNRRVDGRTDERMDGDSVVFLLGFMRELANHIFLLLRGFSGVGIDLLMDCETAGNVTLAEICFCSWFKLGNLQYRNS